MSTPREQLLDILTRMQASHRLYQYEEEYQRHEEAVDDLKIELLELLCPDGDDFDLSILTP